MGSAKEFRVFGPPGTGKTTSLVKQIRSAGERHGYEKVFVASFTRAAAKEISTRALQKIDGLTRDNQPNFGTLHAHGYKVLGGGYQVAENMITEWNKANPAYALSGGKHSDVDEVQESGSGETAADALYSDMNLYRALMVPGERWRTAVRAFADRWRAWKREGGIIDYTDMLEIPLRDFPVAPGKPTIGMLDEAQDASPLQIALFRKWGAEMDFIVSAGDDDQAIFGWCGARPEVMIEGDCAEKRVLAQSYRVPRAVHDLALRTIADVRLREPKEYKPRDADGEVRRLAGANLKTPELVIRDMKRYLDDGKKIMVLASCSYMLDPMVAALRAEGLPFHNPYRVKSGAWNPLRQSGAHGVSSADRLLAFVDQVPVDHFADVIGEPLIDPARMILWYELLKAGGNIPRGERGALIERLENMDKQGRAAGADLVALGWADDGEIIGGEAEQLPFSALNEFFMRECGIWQFLSQPDRAADAVRWYLDNVVAAKQKALEFPARVLAKRGAAALQGEPQIIVGTIHSVKGGEADAVYVAPDMSYAGYVGLCSTRDARDAATRLKYVAYTRSRESLILLDPFSTFVM